jgi:hypothetical protein
MTDEAILAWAKSIYYARVDRGPDLCMHYGKGTWEKQLPELSEAQRAMLIGRIEEWKAEIAKIG